MRKGRWGTNCQLEHRVQLLVSPRLEQLAQLFTSDRKVLGVVHVEKALRAAVRLACLRVQRPVGLTRCVEDRDHPLHPGAVEELSHDHKSVVLEVSLDLRSHLLPPLAMMRAGTRSSGSASRRGGGVRDAAKFCVPAHLD
eukprot:COSAG02_NODE_3992_length_5942_cov_4.028239_6_plen_140_part_00